MNIFVKSNMFNSRYKGNNSGAVLLVALWMMVILSILALGLSRRASIDLSLTRYYVGKAKARFYSWAGILFGLDLVRKDMMHGSGQSRDTLYECGVTFENDQTPEQIFSNIPLGDGHFEVSYISKEGELDKYYGFQDEERRINLNAINKQNYKVLINLISLLGVDEEDAIVIASSVIDWRDSDSNVTDGDAGAEDDYYQSLDVPYLCKDTPFESAEEMLLVRGVTQEIFDKLKDYITVFPKNAPRLLVNLNTASEIVIRSLARAVAGSPTNTELSDADSMAEKIIAYRKGDDGVEYTQDDRFIELDSLGLNAKERLIYLSSRGRMTDISNYIRIKSKGVDESSEVGSEVEAIVFRDDLSIVFWKRY